MRACGVGAGCRALALRCRRSYRVEVRGVLPVVVGQHGVEVGAVGTQRRRQVASAGLGQRLANSWRDKHYPNQRLDAASLVYTKAPQIIRAFDEGALIRSRRGRCLAIPTENAPRKGTGGRQISPSTFPEHRFGPLRFVPRPGGPSLLVVEGLTASFSRKTATVDVTAALPATPRRTAGGGLLAAFDERLPFTGWLGLATALEQLLRRHETTSISRSTT